MTTQDCHVDIESFSEINLNQTGVYRYAEDPSTEILCIMYAFGDEPIESWIPHNKIPQELRVGWLQYCIDNGFGQPHFGPRVPIRLTYHASMGGNFVAHNANFERVMLSGPPGQRIGFPTVPMERWRCTAVEAVERGLPRGLGECAKALELSQQKDERGRRVMLKLSKPRRPSKNNPATRWTMEAAQEDYFVLWDYCANDVLTEREIDKAVPSLTDRERQAYLLDQRINDRGWAIDEQRMMDAIRLHAEYQSELADEMIALTGGIRPSQTKALREYLVENNVDMPDLQAQTVEDALKSPEIPDWAKQVLGLYSTYNMKAPTKYKAMQRAVCKDGRLRGMFKFYGASPGRWSSVIVQLQNLFRPIIDDPEVAVELLYSMSELRMFYDEDPMKILASCVRATMVSAPGKDLIFADYASIEARIVSWLAGAEWKLEIFRTHGLIYEYAASKIWGYPLDVESLKKFKKAHGQLRFLGKIAELACGYQGGKAAFTKMAKQFGADIDEEKAEDIKLQWREANPEIVQMWYAVQDAAILAIANPGEIYRSNRLAFRVQGDWLFMRLPSKRKLAFYKPELREGKFGEKITFMGVDTYTGKWKRVDTYGGKIVQNACEGIARDLLLHGMFQLDDAGYDILGTVHDECINEVVEGEGSVAEVEGMLANKPSWAKGLPVVAIGERTKRYKK